MTDEGLRYTLDLNLSSIILSNRAAVRQFIKQGGGGCILNMGSVLGWSPSPEFFASHAYAAAKAGIIALTKSVGQEVAPFGVRVNAVCPGWVDTPLLAPMDPMLMAGIVMQIPRGRMATADELAELVRFLAGPDRPPHTAVVL